MWTCPDVTWGQNNYKMPLDIPANPHKLLRLHQVLGLSWSYPELLKQKAHSTVYKNINGESPINHFFFFKRCLLFMSSVLTYRLCNHILFICLILFFICSYFFFQSHHEKWEWGDISKDHWVNKCNYDIVKSVKKILLPWVNSLISSAKE